MASKFVKRLYASKGGAGVMFFVYIAVVLVASLMKQNFYDMPTWLGYLIVPGAIFMDIAPAQEAWLGVSTLALFMSLLIYVMVGFVIDYFYKPMK